MKKIILKTIIITAIVMMLLTLVNFVFMFFDKSCFARLAQEYVINNWKHVSDDTVYIELSAVGLITDKTLSTIGFRSWISIDISIVNIDYYFTELVNYNKYYIELFFKNRILLTRLCDNWYCGGLCGYYKSSLYIYLFSYWIKLPFGSIIAVS